MKKQIKKLALSKETLRNLDEKDFTVVLGGQSGSACGNPTCKQDCGPTALC
jgi:natural product precursor